MYLTNNIYIHNNFIMITFIQDGNSLFGEEFLVGWTDQVIPQGLISQVFNDSSYFLKEFHHKKWFWIEDISDWRLTKDEVGIGTFENAFWKKFAVRPDLIQNIHAKFGRERFMHLFWQQIPHVFIPYAEEVKKRGLEIEHAVGFFTVTNQKSFLQKIFSREMYFVIVEIVTDSEKIKNMSENIAFQMGKILSHTHDAWVIHSHPHSSNWVLVDGSPRMVDWKALLLESDFSPKHTCNFSSMCLHDCNELIDTLVGNKNVNAFQDGYRLS